MPQRYTEQEKKQNEQKKVLYDIARILCMEQRKYLNYSIKLVSSTTRISKEQLYNFENGENCLSLKQLSILLKLYSITADDFFKYVNRTPYNKEDEKELKKNNPGLTKEQINELSDLTKKKGY